MIRALCEACGPSGFEHNVRKLLQTFLEPVADTVERDRFGGIVGKKVGDPNGPRILLAGHLDEIGMLVTHVTDKGFIRFQTLGGWWSQVMLAQRVVIHTRQGDILGIIGAKPPHLLPRDERDKVVKIQDMFIDIGVKDKAEAEAAGVRPGDPISPWSPFTRLVNEKMHMGKALDNRLGCATAVAVLRELQGQSHPNIVYAGATAQEEVGLRGAQTLVNYVKPDIAIALDVGIAGDTPGVAEHEARSRLGEGPILLAYDGSLIPNPRFRDFIMDTAADAGIPLQVETIAGGGTDGGRFQLHDCGVPTVSFGCTTRYIHSHAAVFHQDDFDNGVRLLTEVVKRLDRTVLNDILDF
ncbi:MAG: M42 family metallopeptidase [Alicyclobacillaceae bacterium]|nr:M42 family metallopeptidase [Alicyclobacillaceae bacterium]